MLKEFKNDIYPHRLWVATSWEDVKDKFVYHKNNEPIEKYGDGDAYTYDCVRHRESKQCGTLMLFIMKESLPSSYIVDIIFHESTHAVNLMCDEIGVRFDLSNDYHSAYMVQWVSICCWEVLQKEIYKDNK